MLRLKLNGYTYQHIADLYKVSRARAHQIVARRIRQILDPIVPAKTPEEVDLETGILMSPYAEGRGLGVRIDTGNEDMPVCSLCKRQLDKPSDGLSRDCGGDCWGCIREIETGEKDPRDDKNNTGNVLRDRRGASPVLNSNDKGAT